MQQTRHVHELVIDRYAIERGQCLTEEVGAVRVFEHVRGYRITCLLLGGKGKRGIGH